MEWGDIIQESLGAIIPLQTGGFTGIGTYADDNAQAQSGVEGQQDRRRPRLSEEMRRPVESCSDVILRLARRAPRSSGHYRL
jgi:hypothetical protein